MAIVSSFLEVNACGIRQEFFNKWCLIVKKDDLIEILVTYLGKLFKNSELGEIYERYVENFTDILRMKICKSMALYLSLKIFMTSWSKEEISLPEVV